MEVLRKEDTIAKLKDKFQQRQLDSQAAANFNQQDQIDLLKRMNNELTAKNNELEKLVKQLKEKSSQSVNQNAAS